MKEKVEVGERYKNKDTGKICTITEKLLFNTCIGFKEVDSERTQYIRYKDFSRLFGAIP